MVALTLIVVRAADVECTVEFYRRIGLNFVEERHGDGPRHFAAVVSEIVFEIYPAKSPTEVDRSTRLAFSAESLAIVMRRLSEVGADVVRQASHSERGIRSIVRDPDGRTVEIFEGIPAVVGELAELAQDLASQIRNLYLRPQMHVGDLRQTRALECVLLTLHSAWASAAKRRVALKNVIGDVSRDEGCGNRDFESLYRMKYPAASDEDVADYVLSCWRRISSALEIVEGSAPS